MVETITSVIGLIAAMITLYVSFKETKNN